MSKRRKTTEEFIQSSKEIHGNRYDYSSTYYKGFNKHVTIICKKHGVFKQRPSDHIFNGNGCPKCKCSKGESRIIKYLEHNDIKYFDQYKFKECKNKNELPFDFYLPKHNICIEYDGRQHFGGSWFWW